MRRPCIHVCISVTAVCFCRTSDCVRLLQRQYNVTPSTFRAKGVQNFNRLQQYPRTVRASNRIGLAEPRHSLYAIGCTRAYVPFEWRGRCCEERSAASVALWANSRDGDCRLWPTGGLTHHGWMAATATVGNAQQ
jgi:hypothetical protein